MFPPYSRATQAVVAFPSLYLVFMWVLASTTGRWVYGELDWTKPTSPGYYIGLVFLMLAAFGITFGLARAREYHHDAAEALRRGKRGWAAGDGDPEAQVEMDALMMQTTLQKQYE